MLALGGLLAVCTAAPAARAAGAVTVVSTDGATRTVGLDGLERDVMNRSYTVRDSPGEGREVTVTGISLRRVLEAAGADLVGVGYAEVSVSGAPVLLSAGQITSTAGDGPAVVYAQSGGTAFLRPSAGEDDLNGRDQLAAPQITVRLHGGKLLEVKATASRRKADPREPIVFSASVPRSGSGQQLLYSWYFDDGSRERGRRVTHRFARAGNYDVVVGVTSEGDDAGASAVVRVRVGDPPDGRDRKGGGTNQAAGAPDSGAASGSSGAGASGTASDRSAPKRRARAPEPGGDPIEGELLSEADPTSPRRAAGVAARSGRADEQGGGGVPDVAWGLMVTLGLAGVGAALELRPLLRRRGPA